MRRDYTIDVYDWRSPMVTNSAGSGSSQWCQVMSGSSITMTNAIKNHAKIWTTPRCEPRARYWMARWMPDEFGSTDKQELSSEIQERRKWVKRVSELGIGGKVINWVFLSSVSSVLFTSPYSITSLDLGPVQTASARGFTTFGLSQVKVDFPRPPDPLKGGPKWYQSGAGLIISYEYVRGMIV